jgi:hypothetical protein
MEKMNYRFDFLEIGGGGVFNIASTTSSNLAGASVSRSLLRIANFFFGFDFRMYSLSAPSGQRFAMFNQPCYFANKSVSSNALPVGKIRRTFAA